MKLFFDTKPEWLDLLRAWADCDPNIETLWIFGSRAKGFRSPKSTPAEEPDLDVGYTLGGDNAGERLAYAIDELGCAQEQLQAGIAVRLDLQLAEPTDARVWPAILDHGVKIYP